MTISRHPLRWIALAALLLPGVATAQTERDRARELLQQGNRLHDEGHFARALEKFRQAQALHPSYKIELNLANTLDQMGRPAEAATALEQFLQQAPEGDALVPRAQERLAALRQQLASLELRCNVAGAQVTIDDRTIGETPIGGATYLAPGRHQLAVAKPGYRVFRIALELTANDHRTIESLLSREAPPPPPPTVRPPPPPVPVVDRKPDRPLAYRKILAYASLATGVALVSTAAVLYGVGQQQGDEAHERYMAATSQDEMQRHWQDVEAARLKVTAGHVLLGVGAVALGTSVYLFLTRSKRSEDTSARLVPSRAGLGLVASF